MMEKNLLWTGREYYSVENCLVQETTTGARITATILGKHEEMPYKVAYQIKTNRNWETLFLAIQSQYNNRTQSIRLRSDGKGNWRETTGADQFQGCLDVDLSLTPFTNTLPIRRLQLAPNQSQEIQVIYCDLLKGELSPVRQRYTCLSATEYRYENVPNDFEAIIKVDEAGLVVDYPPLFVRTAHLITHYRQ